jgi:hypothetical protein
MKETLEKQVNYAALEFPDLLSMAMKGDRKAAAEIIARQEAQKQEIEQLKVKVSSKRKPAVEKTPEDLFAEKTYYRAAKLLAAFGAELDSKEQLAAMVVCNIMLGVTSLATGNLRQACDRARQCAAGAKAEIELNSNIPVLAKHLQHMIPDENKKLKEQESENARLIFAVKFYEYANVQKDEKKAVFMAFWDMFIQGTTGEPEYIAALKDAIAEETPAEGAPVSEFLGTMQAELKAAEEKKAATPETPRKKGAKK